MKENRRSIRSFCLFLTALAAALALAGVWLVQEPVSAHAGMVRSTTQARGGDPVFPPITISPTLPVDLPVTPTTTLAQAAAFAWQEFIALNWPAATGVRDTPDTSRKFGDPGGPTVWQTFRGKVEIYPGNGNEFVGPHGSEKGPGQGYGYDDPPQYVYSSAPVMNGSDVPPCSGQSAPDQPAWINLDEVSQIGLDSMYAGIVANPVPRQPNSKPNLFRYMAKANRTEYTYVVQNEFWYTEKTTYNEKKPDPATFSPLQIAQNNYVNNVIDQRKIPAPPYVFFPASSSQDAGTIEIKAAWRPLDKSEDASRYHLATVRYYEAVDPMRPASKACYYEDQWALVALHIIRKTPSAPSFIYATFEQVDNIQYNKATVENPDGSIINPPAPSPATTPVLKYTEDRLNPGVQALSGACDPGTSLYYQNIHTENEQGGPAPVNENLPSGSICVNSRYNLIPSDVVAVNKAAQMAIQQYNPNTPWAYYKLVNVQWQPFDKGQIDDSDPNGPYNSATYHQANVVVETDYTLQMFSGRIAKHGAPTDYKPDGTPGFQNVYVLNPSGVRSINMGGCMGCHGNMQVAGNDFSFILGSPVTAPEFPDNYYGAAIAGKYRKRFQRR